MCRGRWLGVLVVAVAAAGLAAADDPKPLMDEKAFDKLVVDTLRDVHDRGADLFNTRKDYAGAYRLYEGSLRTVRPMLAHRPAAQKIIDDGLAAAEKEPDIAAKAFILHKTIEDVRANLRGMTPPKPEDKKPGGFGTASGKVSYKGQPLADGEVTFVGVDPGTKSVAVKAAIKDGKYGGAQLPAGRYAVAVTSKKDGKDLLPAKYADPAASGLTVEVKPGSPNMFDFELKD